jgi:hypothetical protein
MLCEISLLLFVFVIGELLHRIYVTSIFYCFLSLFTFVRKLLDVASVQCFVVAVIDFVYTHSLVYLTLFFSNILSCSFNNRLYFRNAILQIYKK